MTTMDPTTADVAVIAVTAVLYVLPAFIAFACNRRRKWAIALLSLSLGWTVLAWFAAIVWACYRDKEPGA